ncbi:DUF4236 domain-containing protein [Dactylosporangium sucinum]|uniref:DUF4236 domain-containing protein n=1 Tax=Dactylosporangium sucinum TaxID=1424081 RepID=A0A917T6M8_9ACTN|nr:DUF4236 domain-containing protein [Dactylosporangium sucinum]GGM12424.1 hypothetical protein GCM10007977_012040 [Dactylosporangium sucinum]
MGLRIRTSLKAGPFRLTLSPRGIGVSAGVPGFRVGAGLRANYVSVGAGGVRYRATMPNRRPDTPQLPAQPVADVVMTDTTGQNAFALEPTGPGDLVDQLNRAHGRPLLWPPSPPCCHGCSPSIATGSATPVGR